MVFDFPARCRFGGFRGRPGRPCGARTTGRAGHMPYNQTIGDCNPAHPTHWIPERARAGRLVLVDDGAALIDTTYVDNAAEAIAQAVERCDRPEVRGRAFVISNGQPRTVAELVGRIAMAAGAAPPRRHVPFPAARTAGRAVERAWERAGRQDEPPITAFLAEQLATAHWFDQRRTRAALAWRPRVGIEEGLRRLAESMR